MLGVQGATSGLGVLYAQRLEAVRSEHHLISAMINLVTATALFSAMTLGSMVHPTLELATWMVKNRSDRPSLPLSHTPA